MNFSFQTDRQQQIELEEEIALEHKLILHNDNFNTFEWVIETLVDVCKHNLVQAEQCSLLIHNKGKYAVQHGPFEMLKQMKDEITERGINATIE
ncbi:MAG: ATP-dependent Clp protease adaptor ClpS [Bacteroidetes bacterium]|nr:ATP-dependent Clp protease adaptor ClpS [Bacteroidota bacterium]